MDEFFVVPGLRPSPTSTVAPCVIPKDLLDQIYVRPHSARVKSGDIAVQEACKGLSRIIYPASEDDIQMFALQLCQTDRAAIVEDYHACLCEKIPCFAISYVQGQTPRGRFKFSDEEWLNFHAAMKVLVEAGISKCRIWLDQCLWIRDASQGAWAHTGIMPYVLWPVISLGTKMLGGEKTVASYERMWPFVEEISGLWSLGVILTSERRGRDSSAGVRRAVTFNHRVKLEPEETMRLLLLNIYHGATDGLHTGWKEDVKELQEMAKWNVECCKDKFIVGIDWKRRITNLTKRSLSFQDIVKGLMLSKEILESRWSDNQDGVYLDGSRKIAVESWNGCKEWLSGNEIEIPSDPDDRTLENNRNINVETNLGEFQVLMTASWRKKYSIFLLVAMNGRSSGITRGKVAWTKVISGYTSCQLQGNIWTKELFQR